MDNRTIHIDVTGQPGVGKSTVMELIVEAMLEAGFAKEAIEIEHNFEEPFPPLTSLGVRRQSITDPKVGTKLVVKENQIRAGITAKNHVLLPAEDIKLFVKALRALREDEQHAVEQLRMRFLKELPGSSAYEYCDEAIGKTEKFIEDIDIRIATMKNVIEAIEQKVA